MLDQFTQWLATLSSPIATFSEITSGFSTFVIAVLTLFLWRENRALRKAGSEPRVVAYFEPHPDGTGGLNIAIANIGTGPARNVSFTIQGDANEFKRFDLILNCSKIRPPITLIPQGEKISLLFAIGYQLFKPKDKKDTVQTEALEPFNIRIEWSSLQENKRYTEEYLLDVRPYADLPGFINKPHLLKLVDSVKGVEKQIGALKPVVGRLANLIEANTLDSAVVRKVKGNSENV